MKGLEHKREIEHVSNSGLCRFKRCPRLRFYQLCGLQPIGGLHHAVCYGSAFHAAIPLLLRGKMQQGIQAFCEVWGDRDNLEDKNRNTKNAMLLMEAFERGHREGKGLWCPVKPPKARVEYEGVNEDEVPFIIDVGAGVPFVGKIDCVGRHRDEGTIYAVDYKTSSRLSSMFCEGFWFSPQLTGYVMCLRAMMEEEVAGGIVEGIATTITKARGAETQTIVEEVSEGMVEAWLGWVRETTERMLEYEKRGHWPQDPTGCTAYDQFACAWFMCDYWKLCVAGFEGDWTDAMCFYEVGEPHDMFKIKEQATTEVKSADNG